jgi:hypothetical protein
MKRITMMLPLLAISILMFNSACNKDDEPVLPTLKMSDAAGYISEDAEAPYADTLRFGITADYNGTDNLVKFQLLHDRNVIVDSTINTTQFNYEYVSSKNTDDNEVWKFVIIDFAGNTVSDSVIVTGAFGAISTYNSLIMGAQNNTTAPGFASFSNNTATLYSIEQAFNHQAEIDLFCFYENTASHVNLMTLAAPGSNISGIFTGDYSPQNYTTKNLTYFVKTSLSAAEFDVVSNDAKVLAGYDPNNKFKKAKLLAAGEVYSFMLQSGKYGLLKIINVTGAEDGTLEFAVKVQK